MRTLGLTLAFVASAALVTDIAAAGRKRPRASAEQQARESKAFQLFQEARKDFLAQRFKQAADKLEKAYALFPQPMIRFRHAEALENLRKVEKALELYKSIENVRDSKIRDPVRSAIRRLEALLQQPVQVSIVSGDVVGALVFIDGKPYGTTPALVKLSRGKHRIKVTKEGFEPFSLENFVASGIDTMRVEAQLSAFTGMVRVRVPKGNFVNTRVLIDGKLVPIADAMASETAPVKVPVGRHQLECTRSGSASYYRPFVIDAGALITLDCAFSGASAGEGETNWAGIATVSAGGVAMVVGGALLGSYFADVALAEELGKDLVSNKHIIGGTVAGIGLIGVVVGTVLLVNDGGESEDEPSTVQQLRVTPLWLPQGAGLGLHSKF